jgi:hypothetical protein
MPTKIVLDKTTLLPIKTATALVPYSRDYVARLAREGKVVAVQTDRQWFVDGESLKKFYEQSVVEDEVRKRHLSLLRKAELEVKESFRSRLEVVEAKRTAKQQYTVLQAALVVVCGLGAGMVINSGVGYLATVPVSTPTQVANTVTGNTVADLTTEIKEVQDWVEASSLTEVTEPLSLAGGIVLLPTTPDAAVATDFFSDAVTVTMVSTTTGVIRSEQDGTVRELPFVRIPETAEVAVATQRGITETP